MILRNHAKKSFLNEPKTSMHLSKWVEYVYYAQSWKETRLLCVSVFVPIDKQTLTPKNDGEKSFSYETKASMSFILMSRTSL